jgi:hypothetical protein
MGTSTRKRLLKATLLGSIALPIALLLLVGCDNAEDVGAQSDAGTTASAEGQNRATSDSASPVGAKDQPKKHETTPAGAYEPIPSSPRPNSRRPLRSISSVAQAVTGSCAKAQRESR